MISNGFQNCLEFSNNKNNPLINGILNQNPMIITKSESYNFNYTDTDKLKLAQLLVKRDLKNTRDIEAIKMQELNSQNQIIQREGKNNLKSKCKQVNAKKNVRERVSSIKRVPGPQTPNKVSLRKPLPVRSVSPPTKDNDPIWYPKRKNDVISMKDNKMEKLCMKVEQCTKKLDGLERQLYIKSHESTSYPQSLSTNEPKSNRKLSILNEKLHQLMNTKINSQIVNSFDGESRTFNSTKGVVDPSTINTVLNQINKLVSNMNEIQTRWNDLAYEDVSVTSDTCCNLQNEIRFTKCKDVQPWTEKIMAIDDPKHEFNIDMRVVSRLDQARSRDHDMFLWKGCSLPLSHLNWLASDLVDNMLDDVIDEINDTNNQLVDAILFSELDG